MVRRQRVIAGSVDATNVGDGVFASSGPPAQSLHVVAGRQSVSYEPIVRLKNVAPPLVGAGLLACFVARKG